MNASVTHLTQEITVTYVSNDILMTISELNQASVLKRGLVRSY